VIAGDCNEWELFMDVLCCTWSERTDDDDDNNYYVCFLNRPNIAHRKQTKLHFYNFFPIPPHPFVDFVVHPPGHGRNVTDF
jgi:hypothetical protein